MKRVLIPLLWLLIGIGIGGYFEYRRAAKDQGELLRQYRYVRDNFHMTDAEMADFGAHQQEYLAAMKRQDETAASMALGALVRLEHGDVERTRQVLEQTISIYYRGHRQDGDNNVLRHIETFAATNASLSNAIYRKLELPR